MEQSFFQKIFGIPTSSAEASKQSVSPERARPTRETWEIPSVTFGAATEASPRHPGVNQDAYAVDEQRRMLLVADGVGGAARGDVASGAAREAFARLGDEFDELIRRVRGATENPYLTVDQVSRAMDLHFRGIADQVREASEAEVGVTSRPLTTLMTAKAFATGPGEYRAVVKSVGDCQAMVLRADGRLEWVPVEEDSALAEYVRRKELTEDEAYLIAESESDTDMLRSFLAYQAELGVVHPNVPRSIGNDSPAMHQLNGLPNAVSAGAAKMLAYFHNYFSGRKDRSTITASLGMHPGANLQVHSAAVELHPGDKLFLSTDGIDVLRRKDVRKALRRGITPEQQTAGLLHAAERANADTRYLRRKLDDATVVYLEIPREVARAGLALEEVGYEKDMDDAVESIAELSHAIDALRFAHPEIGDLEIIDAGASNPASRDQYISLMNWYARAPGGIDGLRRQVETVRANERSLLEQMSLKQKDFELARARQGLLEAERNARDDDPDSPVWRLRVAKARREVDRLRYDVEASRHRIGSQVVAEAAHRAQLLARSTGPSDLHSS